MKENIKMVFLIEGLGQERKEEKDDDEILPKCSWNPCINPRGSTCFDLDQEHMRIS